MESKIGNVLLVIGFVSGGFTEWLVVNEAAIRSGFYLVSAAVLVAGFGFKVYDRFKK